MRDYYLNRWTQPDSIIPDLTNPQSLNRYAYVLNSPVMYTDPSGHFPETPPNPEPIIDSIFEAQRESHPAVNLLYACLDMSFMPSQCSDGGRLNYTYNKMVQRDKEALHEMISKTLGISDEIIDASEWILKSAGKDFNVPSWGSFGLEFESSYHDLRSKGESVPYSIVVGSVNAAEQLALDYAALSAGVAGCTGGMVVDGPTFIAGDIMECALVGGTTYFGVKFFGQKIVIDILNDELVYPTIDWVFGLFEDE